jgi:hypothetical protein
MAVRFDTNTDSLIRTASLPTYNVGYTLMGWFYLATDRNDYSTFFYLGTDDAATFDYLTTDVDGQTLIVFANGTTVTGTLLGVGAWHHLALVRESGSSLKAYLNGVLDITNTAAVGTSRTAPQRLQVGAYTTLQQLDGRVAGIKLYDTPLTAAGVQHEMHTLRPQETTAIHGWYPAWPGSGERTRDYSGNGRDWTENGTLTDEDPPPVSYGAPSRWLTVVAAGATVAPNALLVAVTFGDPTVTPGAVSVAPDGLAVPVTFGGPTVAGGTQTVTPDGLAVAVTLGQPTLTVGATTVTPDGLAVPVTFGSPTISGAAISVDVDSLEVPVTFGSPTVSPGTIAAAPNGLAVAVTFGSPTVTTGAVTVSPDSLAVPVLFGNTRVTREGDGAGVDGSMLTMGVG